MYKPLALCIYTKNHFSIYGQNPYFHLWGPKGQLAVDQKVNRCWPKFQILKSDVSALCSYFYSSQNPFPGSGILHFLKKVRFFRKYIQNPPCLVKCVIYIYYAPGKGARENPVFLPPQISQRLRVVNIWLMVRLKAEILYFQKLKFLWL